MTNKLKFYWLIAFLLFAALANAQTKDTTRTVDSVKITFSLQQYQQFMQRLMQGATLTREAKKPSEAATATVFILQTYEELEGVASPVYKTAPKQPVKK